MRTIKIILPPSRNFPGKNWRNLNANFFEARKNTDFSYNEREESHFSSKWRNDNREEEKEEKIMCAWRGEQIFADVVLPTGVEKIWQRGSRRSDDARDGVQPQGLNCCFCYCKTNEAYPAGELTIFFGELTGIFLKYFDTYIYKFFFFCKFLMSLTNKMFTSWSLKLLIIYNFELARSFFHYFSYAFRIWELFTLNTLLNEFLMFENNQFCRKIFLDFYA